MIESVIFGTLLGIVAGFTPGLHSNTFAALLLALFADTLPNKEIAIIIVSSAVAYTVADILPTTLLGVPDEETAIAAFPTHIMVLEGRGLEAISISVFASVMSVFVSLPLFFAAVVAGKNYGFIREITPFVLALLSAFIVLSERADEFEGRYAAWRKRFYATLVFLCSGFLGIVALENSELAELHPASSVLLPLLTGLFAVPTLIQSINASIPEQELKFGRAEFTATIKGSLSGFLVSLFPGVSSGVATAVAAAGERSREGYIAAMSSANTANILLCFFILISAGKARSGAADAIATAGYIPSHVEIAATSIIAAIASAIATLATSKLILSKFRSVKQQNVSLAILAFLVIIVYFLTGFFGLAIFFAAATIGIAAVMLGIRRINCMGCLMLPILIRFF